ncbi:MAG: hypothetical protein ACOCRK_04925 [bacterium]
MKVTHRGLEDRIDYCPISKQNYKCKPYANFINDCIYGMYLVGVEREEYNLQNITYLGHLGISDFENFINLRSGNDGNKR